VKGEVVCWSNAGINVRNRMRKKNPEVAAKDI